MPTITFPSTLRADGTLSVPDEAVERLGIRPGDEVQVSVEARNGLPTDTYCRLALSELLEEARSLTPEPPELSSDPTETAFGEALKEKYRQQGFDL